MSDDGLMSVLTCFPAVGTILRVEPLANAGGFSGSRLWRVRAASGEYCLRRWPAERPSSERLAFIHAFQRHLSGAGLDFVSNPQVAATGATFVERDGCWWELASWMPGQANYHQRPSTARLAAAMQALARIHDAAAQMPGQFHIGTSPGLAVRLEQLRQLRSGGMEQMKAAVSRRPLVWDDLARRICQQFDVLALQVHQELSAASSIAGPLFPCLRDIWHDHLLFTGEQVTGVVDFGAARVESPAGDIARLVGSLVGDNRADWNAAMAAYDGVGSLCPSQSVQDGEWLAEKDSRPRCLTLDDKQRQLVRAFDSSGVLLSGANWLTWLYVERREFEDAAAVTERLKAIFARLEKM